MVLLGRDDKNAVYNYLLKEGVIVVKKDNKLAKHQDVRSVDNLKVMMIMRSLKSNNLVNEIFNWRWFYYNLTEKGVKAMR
jgi:small subunit ribosomal protein S10e